VIQNKVIGVEIKRATLLLLLLLLLLLMGLHPIVGPCQFFFFQFLHPIQSVLFLGRRISPKQGLPTRKTTETQNKQTSMH
jgi:hypothetical protein